MKLHFYCGAYAYPPCYSLGSSADAPDCGWEVTIEIDRDIFDTEGASVVCDKCGNQLDAQYDAEEVNEDPS